MIAAATDTRFHWPWLIIGLVLLCLCALGAIARPAAFCAAWLVAWWVWASLALGAQANIWLHDLTGGGWGLSVRPVLIRARQKVLPLCALLIPLVLAMPALYPWAQDGWAPSSAIPAFQATWLSYGFVVGRLVLFALVLNVLVYGLSYGVRGEHRQHRRGEPAIGTTASEPIARQRKQTLYAAIGLLAWGYTVSLLGVDLIMSLTPEWRSSGFGLIVITAQMKLGFAWAVLWAAPHATPGIRRDLGNLLLMYVLMWAYLAYSQFEIIWAENLPDEIIWYVDRLQTGWQSVGIMLVIAGFFLPLFLLLFRALKQNAAWLQGVAALLCLMGVVEALWIVLPSTQVPGAEVWWMVLCAVPGMGFLLHGLPSRITRPEPVPHRAGGRYDSP